MLGWLKNLFGGGSDDVETETPDVANPQLTDAIERLADDPTDERREELHDEILKSALYLAVHRLPKRLHSRSPQVLEQNESLSFRTTTTSNGTTGLIVFTDLDSLKARNRQGVPSRGGIVLPGRDLLEVIIVNKFDGLIIQSAKGWAELSRTEVERLFQKATS